VTQEQPLPYPNAERHLREALDLAKRNIPLEKAGGGPFGAVIARSVGDGSVLARGANGVTRLSDPTAHAEIVAIREAGQILGTHDLSGHVLYSSCEPCPMCLAAAMWARLDAVVFAGSRDDAAAAGFDDARFYDEFKRNLGERTLPCLQALREEGAAAFDLWRANPNRIAY
jgi:guanine deaminase